MSSDAANTNEPDELSDSEMLEELRKTFGRLDRWQAVIASRPEPSPGSELAIDDGIWPWTPPTSLCIASLGNAREHLHAIRRLIEARELFPSVTSTLARSALMSGAIAVWMLAPEEANERHRRMLTFALEDYRNHVAFGTQVSQTFHVDDVQPTADEQMSRLRQRSEEVRSLLEPLGGPLGWNLTDIIIPAALRETAPDRRQRAQFGSRWRVMSGAAHGLLWPHFGATGTTFSDVDPAGVGLATIVGSVGTLAIDYFTAFHVTSRGWALFAARSGWPELAS
jgi:hypothetical protein